MDVLEVEFPPSVPTHSQRQTFQFDTAGRIVRHDYVADVVGWWAHGAHHWLDYEIVGGLAVATHRHVEVRVADHRIPLTVLRAKFSNLTASVAPEAPR